MKYRAICVGVALTSAFLSIGYAQQRDFPVLEGSYLGQEPAGMVPEVFAPDIISSKDNYEFKITFTPDGKEIYFTRGAGDGRIQRQILFTELADNGWTRPEVVSFSSNYMDEYPSISPDGKKLFFQSNRPLPDSWNRKAASHIFNMWITERDGAAWGEPYPINSEANRGYCINYVDDDGTIFFNSASFSKIVRASCDDGRYCSPVEMNTPFKSTECYFSPDDSYVIFSSSNPGYGKLDLYVSFLTSDGNWGKPINLGQDVNSSESESAPVISPDGEYLFYNSNGDFYWVSTGIVEALRPSD
jgi:hypothetical protein